MSWIETRIGQAESKIEYLMRLIADLVQQLRGVQQQAHGLGSDYQDTGGTGNGPGAFFCQPSSTVGGASGSWPTLTAASFTADVYQSVAGALTLLAAAATIYNEFPAGLAAGKVCNVIPDGSGAYVVVTQSCT
jgi:hypothetical protein